MKPLFSPCFVQEAGKATFVGVGGLWNQPMDVSSFAGGFVCNPGYLANMAAEAGLPPFPQFLTNQAWQFGWATWCALRFSAKANNSTHLVNFKFVFNVEEFTNPSLFSRSIASLPCFFFFSVYFAPFF